MKRKYSWIILIMSILTLVPFRVYQKVVWQQNANNYFGIKKMDFGVVAAFLVFVLVIMFMTFSNKNTTNREIKIKKNLSAGVVAIVSSVFIFISSMHTAVTTFQLLNNNKELLEILKKTNDISIEIVKAEVSVQNIILIRCVLGILACIGLLFFAVSSLKGINIFEKYGIVSLFPTIWATVKVVEILMSRVSLVAQNNDIFDMIEAVCLLLFLFMQAKVVAHIEDSKKNKKMFCYGFIAVVAMMIYNVTSIVSLFLEYQVSVFSFTPYIANLILALYIIFFLSDISYASIECSTETDSDCSQIETEQNNTVPVLDNPNNEIESNEE